jgi:hypothetical protein
LAAGKVNRIVTRSIDAQAAKGEAWIERKSRLRGGPCLIQMAEKRQGGSVLEMSQGMISVNLEAPATPSERFDVRTEA